jgi:hypothetical protein
MIVAAVAVVATILAWTGVPVLGVVAGLALVFVLPGYALIGLVGTRRRLGRVERIVLTPALSLTVCVLGGILLDLAHIPLRTPAWALLTGAVTVIAALFGPRRRLSMPTLHARVVVPAVLVLALLGGAGWISAHSATQQRNSVAVTSLSMVAGAPGEVAIDVRTENAPAATYRLVVTNPDGTVLTMAPGVGRDGQWRRSVEITADGRITADLYRSGVATPYRSVYVDVS